MKISTKQLSRGAVIAALYAAICFFLKPLSYGPVQFRISEVLCVLPVFIPEAIPGLFIGCIIANLLGGASVVLLDMVLGSLTTLLAAFLTRRIYLKTKSYLISFIPPVLLNALIVGSYVPIIYADPGTTANISLIIFSILTVGIGELIVIYVLGLPFAETIERTKIFRF